MGKSGPQDPKPDPDMRIAVLSFAGTCYRVGNRSVGQVVGVRVVADTVQITQEAPLR